MEIRNNAEAMQALLGVSSSASARGQQVRGGEAAVAQADLSGDQATLSQIGAEISLAAKDGVRMERVAGIQQALAAGTYEIGADAVADRVIDAMITGGISSGK